MTTPKPKPCPFCGAAETDTTHAAVDGAWTWGAVVCANEPCEAQGPWKQSEAAAIAAWNRAPRPATTAATQAGADAARARGQAVRQRRALRRARLRGGR